MNRADGERMKCKERTQWVFCCTIFKVYHAESDQRDEFNEAVFLVFSHPLFTSPQMPLRPPCRPPLSLSTPLHSVFSLFLRAYLPFSYLFASVSSLTLLPPFTLCIPFFCAPISPRWIIAQRTVQRTQVRIMSLRREHCCLSQARRSKV